MDRTPKLRISDAELQQAFGDSAWREKFPPILNIAQAAELAGVPKATLYDWSSRGLLSGCARRKGKRLRFLRDRFIKFLFES
jgi:hypothetical protein